MKWILMSVVVHVRVEDPSEPTGWRSDTVEIDPKRMSEAEATVIAQVVGAMLLPE